MNIENEIPKNEEIKRITEIISKEIKLINLHNDGDNTVQFHVNGKGHVFYNGHISVEKDDVEVNVFYNEDIMGDCLNEEQIYYETFAVGEFNEKCAKDLVDSINDPT